MELSPKSLPPLTPDRLQPLSESREENLDDWGENMQCSPLSTQGSPWRSQTHGGPWRSRSQGSRAGMRNSRSAPLLPAAHSTQTSTWYSSGSNLSTSTQGPNMWSSLCGTWRERETDEFGSPARRNVDEAQSFSSGCIPNWNKMHLRKIRGLEHELTWCYYRMKRHAAHPMREEVGEKLPNESVVKEMRAGTANSFVFWRDLRPPFGIISIHRDRNAPDCGQHPDGELFNITYNCKIDYRSERLWNCDGGSDAGTFDNTIQGVASVRIPEVYPQQRNISIVSWGRPSLNWTPEKQHDEDGVPADRGIVNPNNWMPISNELGLRAKDPRFAACREATRKANSRRSVDVAPLGALLLGPHAPLTRLAAASANSDARRASVIKHEVIEGGPTPAPKKKRQHCIYTAAAGFVRFSG